MQDKGKGKAKAKAKEDANEVTIAESANHLPVLFLSFFLSFFFFCLCETKY